MIVLIKTQFIILKGKFKRLTGKWGSICIILAAFLYAISICGMTYISEKFIDFSQLFFSRIIFFILIFYCITYLPLRVYQNFIFNKEFDILFLAPISLFECFAWNFLKQIARTVLPVIAILTIFIPTIRILKISGFSYFFGVFMLLVCFNIVYILFELVLYILMKNNVYQVILLGIGIQEIIIFFIIGSLLQGNTSWLQSIQFDSLITGYTLVKCICVLLIFLFSYMLAYYLFRCTYYVNGVGYKNTKRMFNRVWQPHNMRWFWLWKDEKVFLRDFDRLKYILITIIIYIISVLSSKNKVGANSVYILLLTFILISGLQITIENISAEKEKKEIFYLSGITKSAFINHKYWFSLFNTSVLTFIYGTIILIFNPLTVIESIELCLALLAILVNCLYIFSFRITFFNLICWYEEDFFKRFRVLTKVIINLILETAFLVAIFSIIYTLSINILFKCGLFALVGCISFILYQFKCNKYCNRD